MVTTIKLMKMENTTTYWLCYPAKYAIMLSLKDYRSVLSTLFRYLVFIMMVMKSCCSLSSLSSACVMLLRYTPSLN